MPKLNEAPFRKKTISFDVMTKIIISFHFLISKVARNFKK